MEHVALKLVAHLVPGKAAALFNEVPPRAPLEGIEVNEGLVGNHAGEREAKLRMFPLVIVSAVEVGIIFNRNDLLKEDEAVQNGGLDSACDRENGPDARRKVGGEGEGGKAANRRAGHRVQAIDPKVVELQIYNGLPHLAAPVVHDPKKVILALKWVVNEMEKRYQIFAKVGARNISGFNSRPKKKPAKQDQAELPLDETGEGFAVEMDEEVSVPREDDIEIPDKLSYIVVIIDELADLMLMAKNEVEGCIARITQMARAAGIHCIVATQRPSVDVIPGVIKANIPARIAFQVAARVDSRTILDAMGADKLLGKGDMLYQPPGAPKPIRAQGPLVEDQEIEQIVDFIAEQGKPSYEMEIHQQLSKPTAVLDAAPSDEEEELIQQCIEVIRSEQKASVSKLQRRLRLGYNRAARLMDELEDRGIVGPAQGNEPREILIDLDGTGADGRGQTMHTMV